MAYQYQPGRIVRCRFCGAEGEYGASETYYDPQTRRITEYPLKDAPLVHTPDCAGIWLIERGDEARIIPLAANIPAGWVESGPMMAEEAGERRPDAMVIRRV